MGDASEALLMPSFVLRSAEHFGVTNAVASAYLAQFRFTLSSFQVHRHSEQKLSESGEKRCGHTFVASRFMRVGEVPRLMLNFLVRNGVPNFFSSIVASLKRSMARFVFLFGLCMKVQTVRHFLFNFLTKPIQGIFAYGFLCMT